MSTKQIGCLKNKKKVKKYFKTIPWIYENHFLYFKLNSNNINEGSYNELCRKTERQWERDNHAA